MVLYLHSPIRFYRVHRHAFASSVKNDVLCLIEDSAIEAYVGVEVQLHALITSAQICVSVFRTACSNAHINCLLQNCAGCSSIVCKAAGLASSGFESPQWQGVSYWTVCPVLSKRPPSFLSNS